MSNEAAREAAVEPVEALGRFAVTAPVDADGLIVLVLRPLVPLICGCRRVTLCFDEGTVHVAWTSGAGETTVFAAGSLGEALDYLYQELG